MLARSLRHALALRAAVQPLAPAGLRACRWHSAGSHSSQHSSDSIVQIFGMPSFATEQDVRGMITKLKVQVEEVVPTFSDAGQPRTSWFVRCSNDNGQLSRSRSLNLGKIQVVAKRVSESDLAAAKEKIPSFVRDHRRMVRVRGAHVFVSVTSVYRFFEDFELDPSPTAVIKHREAHGHMSFFVKFKTEAEARRAMTTKHGEPLESTFVCVTNL